MDNLAFENETNSNNKANAASIPNSLGITTQQLKKLEKLHENQTHSKRVSIVVNSENVEQLDKKAKKKLKEKRKKELKAEKERLKREQNSKEWINYNKREKILFVIFSTLKVILFIVLLYLFLLSLNFMTIGFTMVSGYVIKGRDVIKFVLSNPFAALAIGIIATAIMQNATATTSKKISIVILRILKIYILVKLS